MIHLLKWIPFAAAVCRYEDIINKKFDENFTDYSYLEDIDFSLSIKKVYCSFKSNMPT